MGGPFFRLSPFCRVVVEFPLPVASRLNHGQAGALLSKAASFADRPLGRRLLKGRSIMAVAYRSDRSGTAGACLTSEESHQCGPVDAAGSLAPMLEGARARGVADAFELAGQAVILLGGAGDVLHAGESAKPLLGEGLRVTNGRLTLKDSQNRGFDSLLESVLVGDEPPPGAGITLAAPGGGEMRLRLLPFSAGKANPAQLLKALVLLDRVA